VRRECAQSLGRFQGDGAAIRALAEAAPHEPDVMVRLTIVHALAAHGAPARDALDRIARDDADARVRDLARNYRAAGR
jgi:hypothetical protein